MGNFTIPGPDAQAAQLFAKFAKAMGENFAVLGFEPGDNQAVQDASTAFANALDNQSEKKSAYEAAVDDKKDIRRDSSTIIRGFAQRIKNNPAATNEIKAAFGIRTTPPPTLPVQVPRDLTALGYSDSTATLKWKANGNPYGTIYLIEVQFGGVWSLFGTTNKTTFKDNDAPPGVMKTYRVRAQRASQTSGPSNEAVIYSTGDSGEALELAA